MIKDHGGLEEADMLKMQEARRDRLIKGNLRYETGENGEGLWTLPCTEQDVTLAEDDGSDGEVMHAWLCNDPICTDVRYGSKVQFRTNGGKRPYSQEIASPEAQKAYQKVLNGLVHH